MKNIFSILIIKELIIWADCLKSTDEQIIHTYIDPFTSEIPRALSENYSISVNLKFILNQIIDLDERQQILTTSIFIEQRWHHHNLRWTHLNMSSVKAIRMPETHVWTPDTYIHNNADDIMSGFLTGVYVLINSNGEVQWPVRAQLKTFCPIDITMFPFDVQTCHISIGSWVHTGQQHIFYKIDNIKKYGDLSADLTGYTDNSDWILVSAIIQATQNNGVNLILKLQRRSFFYIWILIVPFIMLTFLSLMTFRMPSTSNEKLSLSLNVFMAFSMFMIMISERIPPATKHVPLIGIYLATIMTMTATSIFITVLIINIYQHKGFIRPSYVTRHIFIVKLASMLKIYHSKSYGSKETLLENKSKSSDENKCNSFYKNCNFIPLLMQVANIGSNLNLSNSSNGKNYGLKNFGEDLKFESKFNDNKNRSYFQPDSNQSTSLKYINNNKIEWELIAVVLDYLFFYIFIVTYLLIYMAIFLTPFFFKVL